MRQTDITAWALADGQPAEILNLIDDRIGLGRAHKGLQVKLLIADRDIHVIDLQGQLIRELTLDPTRDYQPLTAP